MTNTTEEATNPFIGGYFYSGNGDWSLVEDTVSEDGTLEFRTRSVSYETVPHDKREQAYEAFDGDGKVLILRDGVCP